MYQMEQSIHSANTVLFNFLYNNSMSIILEFIKHYLLYYLFSKHIPNHASAIFLSMLTPFTIYQILNGSSLSFTHILLLFIFNFYNNQYSSIALGVLIVIQPTYILLIVPIILNKSSILLKQYIINIVLTLLILYLGVFALSKVYLY